MIDILDMHEAIDILTKINKDTSKEEYYELFGKKRGKVLYALWWYNGMMYLLNVAFSEQEKNKFVEHILDKFQKEKICTKEGE